MALPPAPPSTLWLATDENTKKFLTKNFKLQGIQVAASASLPESKLSKSGKAKLVLDGTTLRQLVTVLPRAHSHQSNPCGFIVP
jgi:hypothetical protein